MRILKIVLGLLLLVIVAGAVAFVVIDEPRPEGIAGPEAEAMAEAMMAAAGVEAWNQDVGVIEWDFGGRRDHLWDRQRNLVRVRWPGHVALFDLATEASHVTKDGEVLTGEAQTAVRKIAYEAWANDSFWLNPIAKLKDEGTQRAIVETEEGEKGLLITYGDGGVTPGDSYLWLLGQDGLPKAWRMWVSIIPIGGLKITWQDYKTLAGGSKVATRHEGPLTLELSKIKSAPSISELYPDADPFAPLFAGVPNQPSSQPAKPAVPAEPEATPEPAAPVAPAAAPTPPTAPKSAPSPAPAEEL
jgi:hypothetical protein